MDMKRASLATAFVLSVSIARLSASGHGPVFGGATPTLGKGGWQFDQAWMGRTTAEATEQNLRSMISFGITERLQVSTSFPVPLTTSVQPPMGRMTATMSDAPNLEVTGGWRFQTRPVGHGARLESTVYVGGSVPTAERGGFRSGPATSFAAASGYASRVHYFWVGAGYEKRFARAANQWGDVGYYSLVYGYRPPALQLDYPKPDLRFFIEGEGEINRLARANGRQDQDTGGHLLFVGPTTLLLYKQYGLSGGILFPIYRRVNGTQPREHYRVVINATYFFWLR
jgi:hypothetical protein